MKDFNRKKEISLALLGRTNIKQTNYLPPLFPFLWKFRIEVPPPHFTSFWALVLIMGLPCGICGIGLHMMAVGEAAFTFTGAFFVAMLMIIFFGGAAAVYYRISAQTHGLPRWKDI